MKTFNITELAKKHGAEKLRFFFPANPTRSILGISFTSSEDESVVVEAKSMETFNRLISNGYKMILQPIDSTYSYEHFYICDFESLCSEFPKEYYVMVNETVVSIDIYSESV